MCKIFIAKIISGGQTGIDRATLDIAMAMGIPHGGWCPKGRIAEDGTIPSNYQLQETKTSKYAERTELNIKDSDGTLILIKKAPTGGTKLTIDKALELKKPHLICHISSGLQVENIIEWIIANNIHTLNIAGPRESEAPGIYKLAYAELKKLLANEYLQLKNTTTFTLRD